MRRWVKWVVVAVAAIGVLTIAALVALPALVDTPRIQALLASSASQALGRPVKFTSASVTVLPMPSVALRGLTIADDPKFGTDPFLTLDEGQLRLRLGSLLTGRVEFGDLILKQPLITLIQNPDGRWNVASLGGSREPAARGRHGGGGGGGAGAALASRVKIDKGLVTYVARGAGGALTKYRVEDLALTLEGGGGGVRFEGDARVKPGDLSVKLKDGKVGLNGARTLLEAPVSARITLDGKDLKDLVATAAGPSPTIGGGIKGTLAVAGTVGAPRASGPVELSSIKVTQTNPHCPAPTQRTLTLPELKLNAAWEDGRFTGRPLSTSLGGGAITGNLATTLERGVHVQLSDLAIKGLPLEKVLVDFLCQGYAVTGPLDLTGALSLEPGDLWRTLGGRGQLHIGPGKVVGAQALALLGSLVRIGGAVSSLLAADLPSSLFGSPLDFDSITGTYTITNGVATTRDLLYTSRAMKVLVAGDYTLASGRMNLDMVVNHGRGEVKARVTGTSASPSIQVAPSTILKDLEPGKAERGLQDLLKRFR